MRARTAFHPRAALLSAAGVFTLVGAIVLGGALSAEAVPTSVTIGSLGGGSLAPGGVITGTIAWNGVDGGNVRVNVTDTNGTTVTFCAGDEYPVTATTWACNVDLEVGTNTVQAVAEDIGEPGATIVSNVVTFTRGTVDPLTLTYSGSYTDGTSVEVGGAGPVGGSVYVQGYPTSTGAPAARYCATSTVDDGGQWSCVVTVPALGEYSLQAVGTDVQGDPAVASDPIFFDFVGPAIQPEITCGFSPGGSATVSAGPQVNASLSRVQPGTGGPMDTAGLCSGRPGTTVTDLGPYDEPLEDCLPTCDQDLVPGVYNVHYYYSDDIGPGYELDQFDYFFTIPAAPTVSAVSSAGRATGSGTPGSTISVVNSAGTQLCTAIVDGAASWSCAVPQQRTAGQARAFQVDAASGGMSDFSGYVTVPAAVVTPAPAPAPTPTPTPTPRPWSINFGTVTEFRPGDSLTIDGTDAPANATIDVELHSTPILLGTTTADELGNFSLTTTIPMDAEAGDHHIVVIAMPTDGSAPFELEQAVTVIVDPVTEEAEETDNADGAGIAPSHGASRQQPGAPSALSAGFVSPTDILSNPLAVVTAGSLGLALVLLVLVPAEFFGEALANHYGSMAGFFARRRGLKRVVDGVGEWIETHRFLAGAALVFVTSVVFCFIDPSFGFDLTSLRLLLSCAASILLVNFLSSGITERVAEKAWSVPTRLEVMPWGLAIAIVGVIASRILNFSPGFLIGSIIGVSVIGAVSKKLESRVILLWSGVVWAIAMVAWVLAPLVPALPATDPAAFFTGLLGDSLTATAAAGLTALLVALLPIALFDGGVLFKNSKRRWAIAFGIAVASFSLVVLPSASNWLGLGDGLLTWLLLTLGFIAVAIITYLIAVRKNVLGNSRLLKKTEPTA